MTPKRLVGVLGVLATVSMGCGSIAPGQSASAPAPSVASGSAVSSRPAVDVTTALALIDATNLAERTTIQALQAIRFTDEGTAAAAQRLGEGVTGDALWAATWIYVSSGTDHQPLLPLLDETDESVRALAAAGLTARGRLEGLDALIALLGSSSYLQGSHPPADVAQYASATLSRYTADAVVGDQAAWQAWLDQNRVNLTYDATLQLWQTP